jgi:cytochrome c
MSTNNVVIAHPKDVSEINALKAFMEALHIKFEIEEPYNKEFVEKIKKSKKQYEKGNFITIEKNKINEFLGL